jgi:hypothetical protein
MDRGKEVVRLGSAETKVVKPVLRATRACWRRIGILYCGGGLGNGNGTV